MSSIEREWRILRACRKNGFRRKQARFFNRWYSEFTDYQRRANELMASIRRWSVDTADLRVKRTMCHAEARSVEIFAAHALSELCEGKLRARCRQRARFCNEILVKAGAMFEELRRETPRQKLV